MNAYVSRRARPGDARRSGRPAERRLGFSAAAYLDQARHALAEAEVPDAGRTPGMRYVDAHLAALRCAAAVLAVRGRPTRRGKGTAWTELTESAPELADWAAVFAAGAELRAAAESGVPVPVTHPDVDEFCGNVAEFLGIVEGVLGRGGQALLPQAS